LSEITRYTNVGEKSFLFPSLLLRGTENTCLTTNVYKTILVLSVLLSRQWSQK